MGEDGLRPRTHRMGAGDGRSLAAGGQRTGRFWQLDGNKLATSWPLQGR